MILRKNNKNKFTVINEDLVRDERLSLKDFGLLVKMLSLPDNWDFSEKGLVMIFKQDGQTAIRSGLNNLEECGYLHRERTRNEDGTLNNVVWTLYDYPHLENPSMDNPSMENQPQYNTKESNTKESKTKFIKFIPPTVDEVSDYCRERDNGIDAEAFVSFYQQKDWYVGKNKMVDWKASVRYWERNRKSSPKPNGREDYFLDFMKKEAGWND